MSIWSECFGVIVLPKTSKFSLRKFCCELYDEVIFHELAQESVGVSGQHYIKVKFKFVFSLSGNTAASIINDLCVKVDSVIDQGWSEIEANIRFR